ncbi:MAG: hypothetical protein HQL56_02495 [Magnetococcales bacterium]|nr:hypothetical protein [Magnetococcales bacterium]
MKKWNEQAHIFVLLLVTGCNAYADDVEYIDLREKPNKLTASVACPSRNFNEFLDVFREDLTVQKAYTRVPLEVMVLDLSVKPEPEPVVKMKGLDEIQFPVIDSKEHMKKKSSKIIAIEHITSRLMQVVVNGDGINISYFFSMGQCWELNGIDDWSRK